MKSPLKKSIGEVVTDYGTKVMKVFKEGLLGRSLFDFYGDVKALTFRTKEVTTVPTTPPDSKGGVIYTKSSDGKLYYKSNEVAEVELSASDTVLTSEQVQDIVGAMFSGNTETNITVTYQDADGTIDLAATDTNTTYSEATGSAEGLMSIAHHDKLDGIESSADVTDTTNVTAAGALMDSELTDLAGVKSLDTSTLVTLAGTQTITGGKTFERAVILDADKSITPSSDGVTLHIDSQDITDTDTSGSGTATTFNHVVVENPRLLAVNSSVTTTNASTLFIKGAPIAHTNQTITNAYALYVAGGNSYFNNNVTVGGDLTVNGDTVTFESANADDPHVIIKNTNNGTNEGARLDFNKLRADDGVEQGQNMGEIWFTGQDSAQNSQDYAYIVGEIDVSTNGQESGQIVMGVANHDGGVGTGFKMTGGSVNDEIDVTIGFGSSSLTTIVGDLQVSGNDIKDSGGNTILSSDGSGVVTMAGGNIAVGGSNADLNMNSGSDIILEADNAGGGNTSTIQYLDAGGTNRIILGADSDVAILSNRASNGTVQIRANTSTAGGSGEVTVVTVEDDKVTISQDLDVTGKITTTHDYHATTFENQIADDVGTGKILKYSPGANDTLNGSEIYFLHTDGTWNQADADDVATGASQMLGVGLGGSSQTVGCLIEGFIRIASTEILNTPGSGAVDGLPLYVSTTPGHFDFTAPSGSSDFVRIVGYALDDNSGDVLVYFNPDKTWVEIA